METRWIVAVLAAGIIGYCAGFWTSKPPLLLVAPKEEELVLLNGCVLSACHYLAAQRACYLLRQDFWARVLLVRFEELSAGHAYCVWEVDGQMFGYDRSSGAFPIAMRSHDPVKIAQAVSSSLRKVLQRDLKIERAEFVGESGSLVRF